MTSVDVFRSYRLVQLAFRIAMMVYKHIYTDFNTEIINFSDSEHKESASSKVHDNFRSDTPRNKIIC